MYKRFLGKVIYNKFVCEWTNYVIVDGRQLVVYGPGDVVCICVCVCVCV